MTISVGTQLLEQKSEQSVKKTKCCELRERSLSVLSLSNGSRKDLTCPSAGESNSEPVPLLPLPYIGAAGPGWLICSETIDRN